MALIFKYYFALFRTSLFLNGGITYQYGLVEIKVNKKKNFVQYSKTFFFI